jgi:hypothetical protein
MVPEAGEREQGAADQPGQRSGEGGRERSAGETAGQERHAQGAEDGVKGHEPGVGEGRGQKDLQPGGEIENLGIRIGEQGLAESRGGIAQWQRALAQLAKRGLNQGEVDEEQVALKKGQRPRQYAGLRRELEGGEDEQEQARLTARTHDAVTSLSEEKGGRMNAAAR